MEQTGFGSTKTTTKLDSMSKEQLIERNAVLEFELAQLIKDNYALRNQRITDEQLQFVMNEQLESLTNTLYGKKSERYRKPIKIDDDDGSQKKSDKPRIKQPSERYPNIVVNEKYVELEPLPSCPCCNKTMIDSDLTEDSEQLTVIPKKYEILRIKRVKYVCDCHQAMVTAPAPARIIDGSTYSDEMITDVALSKYCDLIPINRYVAMADRAGLVSLPANSLIETTHSFADFVSPVYTLIKQGILNSRVLRADETPHKMLEGGGEKKSWYLWGFSTESLCFLECRDTRSGDIASDLLVKSQCEVLVSDVYTGYGKAIRVANEQRRTSQQPLIVAAHCNAHARRNFFKMWPKYPEAAFYLEHYHEIYQLNSKAKGQAPPHVLEIREQMRPRFEAMKAKAMEQLGSYSLKGKYANALKYYLKNYATLTYFLTDAQVPIDNNAQERNLRSHVVGRKTWYGTHSQRGALTAAILFSIVETCKLIHVNPRQYFEVLVKDLLEGAPPYTPLDYKTSH